MMKLEKNHCGISYHCRRCSRRGVVTRYVALVIMAGAVSDGQRGRGSVFFFMSSSSAD